MAKKSISGLFIQVISGANIVTALLMILTGYSYLVNPMKFSLIGPWGLAFPFFLAFNLCFLVFWLFFHRKKAYIPFLTFIICYFPVHTYLGLNANSEVPEGAIKVMSYNVLGFHGLEGSSLSRDSNEIAQYFIDEDCDVICVQEPNEPYLYENCQKKLFEHYPYHREDIDAKGSRLAIYSKHKILSADTLQYEAESAISIAYTLDINGKEIYVINNHLERSNLSIEERQQFSKMIRGDLDKHEAKNESKSVYSKLAESALLRAPQAQTIAKYIEEHKDKKMILMGDFNDNPISYTHYAIAKNLKDCFVHSGRGLGWSYCHHAMRVRIDNIMCSQGFTPYNCKVDDQIKFSDHYPVKCWLKID